MRPFFFFPIVLGVLILMNLGHAATFTEWRNSHFTPAQLSNPAISGAGANLDGDSFTNLQEYAFALEPFIANGSDEALGLSLATPATDGLLFTYAQSKTATDLLYQIEYTDDLTNNLWNLLTNPQEPTVPLDLGQVWQRSVLVPAHFPKREFLRLRLHQQTNMSQPIVLNDPPQQLLVKIHEPFVDVDLAWIDRSNQESGYRIERRAANTSSWTHVGTTAYDTRSFRDQHLTSDTLYYYRVRAVLYDGSFATASSEITLRTPLDSDNDNLPDWFEVKIGTSSTNRDSDNDGLDDAFELLQGTRSYGYADLGNGAPETTSQPIEDENGNPTGGYTSGAPGDSNYDPNNDDSDNDGISDGDEDNDNDGLTSTEEDQLGIDPENPDSDDDGVMDGLDGVPYDADFKFPSVSLPRYAVIDLGLSPDDGESPGFTVYSLNNKGEAVMSEGGFTDTPLRNYIWRQGTRILQTNNQQRPRKINDQSTVIYQYSQLAHDPSLTISHQSEETPTIRVSENPIPSTISSVTDSIDALGNIAGWTWRRERSKTFTSDIRYYKNDAMRRPSDSPNATPTALPSFYGDHAAIIGEPPLDSSSFTYSNLRATVIHEHHEHREYLDLPYPAYWTGDGALHLLALPLQDTNNKVYTKTWTGQQTGKWFYWSWAGEGIGNGNNSDDADDSYSAKVDNTNGADGFVFYNTYGPSILVNNNNSIVSSIALPVTGAGANEDWVNHPESRKRQVLFWKTPTSVPEVLPPAYELGQLSNSDISLVNDINDSNLIVGPGTFWLKVDDVWKSKPSLARYEGFGLIDVPIGVTKINNQNVGLVGANYMWINGQLMGVQDFIGDAQWEYYFGVDINDQNAILGYATKKLENEEYENHAVMLLPVEFIGKGSNGELKPQLAAINGTAAPVITANVSGCSISDSGIVSLSVSGNITDETSDLIDTPSKQLQTLTVKRPGGSNSIQLSNTAAPQLPWKPYQFKANFSTGISFSVNGPGYYPIELTTSENAGGMAASIQQSVVVTQFVTNIVLSGSLNPSATDSIRFYNGVTSSGDASEVMAETAVGSKTFVYSPTDQAFKAEIRTGGTLTTSVDHLIVRFYQQTAPNTYDIKDVEFTESGPETKLFVNTSLNASCGSFPKCDPGAFMPIMLRFPAIELLEGEDRRINTMDRDWKLKKKDFGDGEYLYVVDDQEKAVVFNPSVNAHTHIQTKPIESSWAFKIMKGGNELGVAQLNRADGLLVRGQSVKNYLGDSLVSDSYEEVPLEIGGTTFYNYRPKKDEQGNVLPVQRADNANNAIKEEVLWKYVTAKNTVVILSSLSELKRDIEYRKNVVASVQSAHFSYTGDGGPSDVDEPKWNPAFWNLDGPLNAVMELTYKGAGTSAYLAVQDVFTNPNASTLYVTACQGGARYVVLQGLAKTLGRTSFDNTVGSTPLGSINNLIKARTVAETDVGRTFWIPGDWGNIVNLDFDPNNPETRNREGENVIYLGGTFTDDYASFKNTAQFWGHGFGIKTLNQMMNAISGWGRLDLSPIRRDLDQENINQFQNP